MDKIEESAKLIANAKCLCVFTGAGVSKESGIPTFRGSEDSVYENYDQSMLELNTYIHRPEKAWPVVNKVFYKFFKDAQPNAAHKTLAKWEKEGLVKAVITQNIDSLHQAAGNKHVIEFHGGKGHFVCLKCGKKYPTASLQLTNQVPHCECGGVLKPGFIFFGEGIPEDAYTESFDLAGKCDVMLVIGTTGEVQPAAYLPHVAKQHGAKIIEVNPQKSAYTDRITDIYLDMGAVEAITKIDEEIQKQK